MIGEEGYGKIGLSSIAGWLHAAPLFPSLPIFTAIKIKQFVPKLFLLHICVISEEIGVIMEFKYIMAHDKYFY